MRYGTIVVVVDDCVDRRGFIVVVCSSSHGHNRLMVRCHRTGSNNSVALFLFVSHDRLR